MHTSFHSLRPRLASAALVFAGLILAPVVCAQIIIKGTEDLHYAFEDNLRETGTTFSRSNPVARGTLAYGTGAIGRAVVFSGDDEIDFPAIGNAILDGDFTLAWFMKLSPGKPTVLLSRQFSCTAKDELSVTASGSPARITATFSSISGTASLTANAERDKWVHLALVRVGSRAQLSVDGVAVDSTTLPAMNLQGITSPFGLGNSPCIDGISQFRPVGRFDELRAYDNALTLDQIKGLASRPSFTATPTAATVGGKIVVRASHLVVGRNYELKLSGPTPTTLFNGPANATSMSWTPTLPSNLGLGSYKLQLVATLGDDSKHIERSVLFTVTAPLSISASSPLQAGKAASFSIGNLLKGGSTRVRLVYAGRVIAGPILVENTTQSLRVTLPSDIPTSLPASVAVRAEMLYGRIVSHLGSRTVTVGAPFTGKFATTTQFTSSRALAKPSEPVSVSGKLTLADGATPATTGLTAFWVGDNGDVTPLSVKDLAIDTLGNFQLGVRPPSLGSMTAMRPQSSGHIRLVGSRTNAAGRKEWVTEEGPLLETVYDTDPDTDITVRVRRNIGGGVTEALQGAYVVLSAAAPLDYQFDLPGSDGGSGDSVGGASLYGHQQPLTTLLNTATKAGSKLALGGGGAALNQVFPNGVPDWPPPPAPACGDELYRRYTNIEGEVEFPVRGGPEEEADTFQRLSSMQVQADNCGPLGCDGAQIAQIFEFYLSVYTLHKGAGVVNQNTGAELPATFKIQYKRDTETFTIRNLRTGVESVQVVSANLAVEVNQIAQSNHIGLSDPRMWHEIGGVAVGVGVTKQTGGGFGKWVDFSGTGVDGFANPSPDKILTFGHRPDAHGSLTSAALYLYGLNGNASKIADFQQVSFVDGCNLQDLPGNNQSESWKVKIPSAFANAWRTPQGVFFPANPANDTARKACGYIEVANAVRSGVKRNVCFYWQAPPPWVYEAGSSISVNDADSQNVIIEQAGRQLGAGHTEGDMPNSFLGEPLEEPGDIDNDSNAREAKYSNIGGDGLRDSIGAYVGANPKQFSRDAAGADDLLDPPNVAAVVEFGEDEFQTILDTTIPLFQWYWGVPEILSAEVYARLRLFASYFFHGTVTVTPVNGQPRESLDMLADAAFGAFIMIGVDIDVLFGFIIDAGANLTGVVLAETPIEIINNESSGVKPCFNFKLVFEGYVDPCAFCPTPVIEFGGDPDGVIIDERYPDNCTLYSANNKTLGKHGLTKELAALAETSTKDLKAIGAEMRAARRPSALDFDAGGRGMLLSRNVAGKIVAQTFDGNSLSVETQLTLAMGARDPQIAYFDEDRAVALWAESTLPEAQFRAIGDVSYAATPTQRLRLMAREQRLAWAEWDGESWGAKQILTAAGRGEGQIALTPCPVGKAGCPADGEVLAVWQRDAHVNDADPGNDTTTLYQLWHTRFTPAAGFAAPARIDATPGSTVQDITPSATYLNGRPVVVWARQFNGVLGDFKQRNLAYRVLPDGVVKTVAAAPAVLAPSVVAANTTSIRVAWLRADASVSNNPKELTAGAVGANNALYVTQAVCSTTECTFPTALVPATRDERGRRLYGGERPRLLKTAGSDVVLVMRVFRIENPDDHVEQTETIGDPIGVVQNTGELMRVAPNFSTGIARVTPITGLGAVYLSPSAAYNPALEEIVTGAPIYMPPLSAPFRAALKATGYAANVAYGKTVASNGNLELNSIVEAPDLLIDAVTPQSALAPGTAQSTRVIVANRGATYSASVDGAVTVQLRWNSPGGPVLATAAVASTSPANIRTLDLAWTAPADAFIDEAHTLYAVLDTPDGFTEITDGNNQAKHEFPGLPTPRNLGTSLVPGVPQVQLGWDSIADPRIAGYRVYRKEPDASWTPMGASPVHGFLDLSASFHIPRIYAVTSYSARGIESERSGEVTVMPLPKQGVLPDLLKDGFEDPLVQ